MAMTKTEILALESLVDRLKKKNLGCSFFPSDGMNELQELCDRVGASQGIGQPIEMVSRIYLDTWIIPVLEFLIEKDGKSALSRARP